MNFLPHLSGFPFFDSTTCNVMTYSVMAYNFFVSCDYESMVEKIQEGWAIKFPNFGTQVSSLQRLGD